MAALAKPPNDCYLLTIPGELRDRIYHFCEVDYVPLSEYDKPLHRPHFLSLTQACRQIRNEFRPLYMAHTIVELSTDAESPVANLVPIFYPLDEPHIMAAYRGNLQIVVDVYCNHACLVLDSLLSLLIASPEVKFRFTTHDSFPLAYPAVTQINEFLCHTADPKNVVWRDLFKSIKSVYIGFSDYGHSLIFRMNRQMACEAHSWWAEAKLPTMAAFKIKFRWGEEDGFRSGFVRWDVLDRDYSSD